LNGGYGVRIGRLGVDLGYVRPREVMGVEVPEASGPDFTGVMSPSDVKGEGTELGADGSVG
jgi:hypothetical protein